MPAPVVRVSATAPEREPLRQAATLLRAGRLVAFPTETVYGLGASALDAAAVQRIYDAKGRPAINPIIVHVASIEEARRLARDWTPAAETLARKFWPGPLTLVVRKTVDIPSIVTAGGDTVGLRVPEHPVALALLREAGIPIAAPSANPSNRISPTSAAHVARALGDRVDLILDGGETHVGIESTVVDVTGPVPRVLRPGMISREAIADVIGVTKAGAPNDEHAAAPRSPGLLGRHYSPRARVVLFDVRDQAAAAMARQRSEGRRIGAMVFTPTGVAGVEERRMPAEAPAYARLLYATLHALDDLRCEAIFVERPPSLPEWTGIVDRIERAARSR